MSVVVIFYPDIRSVIGGLRRNSCLSNSSKNDWILQERKAKGIGSSNKRNRIDYDNLNKFATIQPENLSPSTEAPAVIQSKDVNKYQNNNTTTVDKEDKKK